MRRLKKYLSQVRFVYRRSSNVTKCVVIAALLLSTVALLALRAKLLVSREESANLRAQASALEQEKQGHIKDLENKDTLEGVKKYAYEHMDLVDPNAVIYEPVQDPGQD